MNGPNRSNRNGCYVDGKAAILDMFLGIVGEMVTNVSLQLVVQHGELRWSFRLA